ncbi:BppU family phage baseplate upper protein, partial [Citrobacter sp. TBCS-14]
MSLDNFKNRAIVWDTVNKGFPQPIQIMQGDVNARTLSIKILDNGGEIDLTGHSLKLTYQYTNSSNSGFVMIPPENLTKGEFILVIPTEMTETGVIEANLILLNEDKEQVIVSKNLTFISDNSTVTDLAQEVNNKIDDFTKLLLENMPQVMRSELNDLHAQTESNKSNIELKANQTDLNNLQADVSRQGIAISTKAEQSDLLITNQNVTTAQETAKQAESEAKNAMAKATEAQANSLTPTTLNVAWEVGKYNDNNGETVINESMNRTVKFDISGTVELNIKNPTNYTLYKYFLYDKNGAFLRYGEVKNGMSIKHIGKIAFQTAKT